MGSGVGKVSRKMQKVSQTTPGTTHTHQRYYTNPTMSIQVQQGARGKPPALILPLDIEDNLVSSYKE